MNIFTALEILSSNDNEFYPYASVYNRTTDFRVNVDSVITESDKKMIIAKINEATSVEELKLATELNKVEFKFIPDFNSVNFPSISFTNGKANVNMLCEIHGVVSIPECKFSNKIGTELPGKIFRNYSIIHNGKLNMPVMAVKLDEKSRKQFSENGVKINNSPIVILDMSQFDLDLNLINIDLDLLFNLECDLYVNKVAAKTFKALNPKNKPAFMGDPELNTFLAEHGLVNGVFSPKTVITEKVENIPSSEIKVSIKSCSSIPSIKDVNAKKIKNKPLTKSESIVDFFLSSTMNYDKIKQNIKCLSYNVAMLKYAMLLNTEKDFNCSNLTTFSNGFEFVGEISKINS